MRKIVAYPTPKVAAPKQRGVVTRDAGIDDDWLTTLVNAAFADPAVVSFRNQYAISAAQALAAERLGRVAQATRQARMIPALSVSP